MSDIVSNEQREQRLVNLKKLVELGYPAVGRAFDGAASLAEIDKTFQEGRTVAVAGRLMTVRDMGKSIFCDLYDGSGRFQLYANKQHLAQPAFDAFRYLDTGDHIGAEGILFQTRTGQKTLRVEKWVLLSKALLPLPEKWHGLRDVEIRYRQRYLDLMANPEVRRLFDRRSWIIRAIREFLWNKGYVEVETPMMQPQAGGAAARPFQTHYTALNATMFLRIAPELYLKRLLVGGFTKIFELNRNFRNEGLSKTHNPEFTMLEIYEAYSDCRGMQKLVQELILGVAKSVAGESLRVGEGECRIDFNLPWVEKTYRQLIEEKMGPDWFTLPVSRVREKAQALGLEIDKDWDHGMVTHELYEKVIERSLMNPTFVTRLPVALVPLARLCDDDPSVVDVFELVIGGKEVAPGYSELNDPLEQRRRFKAQAGENAQRMDEEFLLALEHGMPPAGGMGIGIDRLVMALTGAETIRDVILFPQLRARKDEPSADQT